MKKVVLLLSLFIVGSAVAQPSDFWPDSLRTVELEHVTVSVKEESQKTNLYKFFTTNKAAGTEDILARLPEISLVRRGSFGMEPTIRSYHAGQINLLLDGMKIHGACTDKMDPASIYIEPQNLKSIDVFTNGGGLMNGSSIGGNINLKLAEASCHDESSFSGRFSSTYHTVSNAFTEALNLNYGQQKWAARLSATYRKASNYRDGNGNSIAFSQYEKANFSGNFKYMLSEHLTAATDFIFDEGWNIGYAALPMDVGYAKARIGALKLNYDNPKRTLQSMQLKIYANEVVHFMDDSHRPNVPIRMDMPGESRTLGAFADGKLRLANHHTLTVKGEVSLTNLVASMTMYDQKNAPMYMLTWPDNSQLQTAATAEYNWQIDSLTKVQLNGRIDFSAFRLTSEMGKDQFAGLGYSNANAQFVLPSVSAHLSRRFGSRFRSGITYTYNGRMPTASELYGFYLFNRFDAFDYIGSPNVQPETSHQGELNMQWRSKKLQLHTSAFVSLIHDYILGEYEPSFQVMTPGAKGVKIYKNAGDATMVGVEAGITYQPTASWNLLSTVKFNEGRFVNGDHLPMIHPLKNLSSVKKSFKNGWISTEVEIAAPQNAVSKSFNEQATPGYTLLHIRAGYQTKLFKKLTELNAGVENIFNEVYREHLDWGNIPRPGRNIYVQLAISF